MVKNITIPILFDTYGKFLSKFQQQCIDCYYNHDLNFSEIAVNTGRSRQGVREAVIRAETFLYDTDKNLGLVEKFNILREKIAEIGNNIDKIKDEKLREKLRTIQKEISKMIESW